MDRKLITDLEKGTFDPYSFKIGYNTCIDDYKEECGKSGHIRIEGEYDGHSLFYCEKCKTDLPLQK